MPTATPFNNLITFSRGSNATVTGSNGLIQWAPNNQITHSEQIDNAAWTKGNIAVVANVAAAPDGTSTADRLVPSNANTIKFANGSPSFSTGAGQGATHSCYAKADGYSKIALRESATTGAYASFDLATASVIETGNAGGMVVSNASVTDVGNGWYRLAMTCTNPASTGVHGFGAWPLSPSYTTGQPASLNWIGNGTSGILIWGAQLELGSTATTYNPTTVKNLLGFSEAFDNALWTKSNSSIVTGAQANPVNGLFNAQKLMENTANTAHRVQQTFNINGAPITLSAYIKAGERTWAYLRLDDASSTKFAYFNLATGAAGFTTSGVTSSIISVGSGWYRCSITFAAPTATASGAAVVASTTADATSSNLGDGNSGVYIYGAQLSDSASLDPYVPTPGAAPSSTAFYGPRFDFDPVTLAPKGLLVEEARTNLILQSGDGSGWGVVGTGAVTLSTGTAPDGSNNAFTVSNATDVVVPVGGNNVYKTFTVSPSTTYTLSLYVKAITATTVSINIFDGSTGANTTQAIALTSGWQRVQVSRTSAAGTMGMRLTIGAANGTVLCWGAQAEAGAFATSYIPTVASTVTRSADVATITGQNFAQWYRQDEGALVMDADGPAVGNQVVTQTDDGTIDDRFTARFTGPTTALVVLDNGSAQVNITSGTVAAAAPQKFGYAYKANDFALAWNGSAVVADTAGTVPTVNRLRLGVNAAGGEYINGHIRNIRYIPARAADFQLQGLST